LDPTKRITSAELLVHPFLKCAGTADEFMDVVDKKRNGVREGGGCSIQ